MNPSILVFSSIALGLLMYKLTGKNGYQWYGIALLINLLCYIAVSAVAWFNEEVHNLFLEKYYLRSVFSAGLTIVVFIGIIWRKRKAQSSSD